MRLPYSRLLKEKEPAPWHVLQEGEILSYVLMKIYYGNPTTKPDKQSNQN